MSVKTGKGYVTREVHVQRRLSMSSSWSTVTSGTTQWRGDIYGRLQRSRRGCVALPSLRAGHCDGCSRRDSRASGHGCPRSHDRVH